MTRTPASQRRAIEGRRRRATARGLARVEVLAAKSDVALVRALANVLLRGQPAHAENVRASLREALVDPHVRTAFDVFGSDLPDEAFRGVFDQPREGAGGWRPVEL